jgi:hypothetical protein
VKVAALVGDLAVHGPHPGGGLAPAMRAPLAPGHQALGRGQSPEGALEIAGVGHELALGGGHQLLDAQVDAHGRAGRGPGLGLVHREHHAGEPPPPLPAQHAGLGRAVNRPAVGLELHVTNALEVNAPGLGLVRPARGVPYSTESKRALPL